MALFTLKQNKEEDVIFQANTIDTISGQDAVVQRIRNRIALWSGEFFINPDDGFDWLDVFNANPRPRGLEDALKLYIEADEYIIQVLEIRATVDRANRKSEIYFEALTNGGIIDGTAEV
jgi:hypothetical protein